MKMEKVSAIITTHNRVDCLRAAIESVLQQTYKNIECIIVDDASTDNTKEVCEEYPVHYIYIPKEESKGGNYARNVGVLASSGKYVAFLDDDDRWLPLKIEKQVALIESKKCDLVFCGKYDWIYIGEKVVVKEKLPDYLYNGDFSRSILFRVCTITSCILALRQAVINAGLFDENLSFWQEYELTLRMAQKSYFYYVPEPLVCYTINTRDKGRLSNKYYAWMDNVRFIIRKHKILFSNLSLMEKIRLKARIWNDGATRAKSSGLLFVYLKNKIMWYIFSPLYRIVDKVNRKKIRNEKSWNIDSNL